MPGPALHWLPRLALGGACLAGLLYFLPPAAAPDDGPCEPVADFSLTERSGRTVTRADLQGKVWVASFVFTRCTGPCPAVTATLARLQHELRDKADVVLVTFTVDPAHDDPGELTRYADRYGAERDRWLFLTGKEDDIYRLVRESFHLYAEPNTGAARLPGAEVAHDTRLAVVDRRGNVRGYYAGLPSTQLADPEEAARDFEAGLQRLREKVAALLREPS